MLVGGGVEDDLGTDALEDAAHLLRVGDITDPALEVDAHTRARQFQVEVMEAGFVVVQEMQAGGAEGEYLAGELAADRAGGTGDQDDAVAQAVQALGVVNLDGLAADQVLDGQLTQVLDRV